MSRIRRFALLDRYFFLTSNLLRSRLALDEGDFEILAGVLEARRKEHGFLLTAWVLLPDHWHAIIGPKYPVTISGVTEAVKVSSTRQINTRRRQNGRLWQGRFFDRALSVSRRMKEYHETVEYIHLNPVRRGLVKRPEDWRWSSAREASAAGVAWEGPVLRIDRVRIPADQEART